MVNHQFMRLSQGQLNLLTTCPRKFQHSYLEKLASPPSPQQQEKTIWASQFHLLMQQRELGLPIECLLKGNKELQQAIRSLINAAPDLLQSHGKIGRAAEHHRTLHFGNYLLVVIYDLLVINDNTAQILDWKTYLKPENKDELAQDWQTRLYLYILAETSSYIPEDISMTYWFVKLPTEPQSLTITYTSQEHQKTQQDLTNWLQKLDDWQESYLKEGHNFPQVPEGSRKCRYCNFASRCQRIPESQEDLISNNRKISVNEIDGINCEKSVLDHCSGRIVIFIFLWR